MKLLTLEEPRALERAIEAMQHGGLVAFPTDTVYGIGASLAHPDSLERIFEIKGRDRERSLPLLLASPGELEKVTSEVDPQLLELASSFWPGPLTIALPALHSLPPQVVAADGTVGVRVPDHSVALILAQRSGGAIAVTSANLSGQLPARRAEEIDPALAENLDLILDGGIAKGGRASTVIRLEGDTISFIREGAVSTSEIQAVWSRMRAEESREIDKGSAHAPAQAG
jgi:L-threonylcarbamoyladenylate synthase